MTPEEFEIKMQEMQEAMLSEDTVRIVVSRAMDWDRQNNRLSTVQCAQVYVNRPFRSGKAQWVAVGLPITVEPEKGRDALLETLAQMVRDGEQGDDLEVHGP